jgi:hypothetical protein
MSTKRENPYKRGEYKDGFSFIRSKRIVTIADVVDFFRKKKTLAAARASATVLLSPRAEGTTRGDCRGNMSAQGHLYYMSPLARKTDKDDNKEPQRFELKWREKAMEPLKRAKEEVVGSKKPIKVKKPARVRSRRKAVAKK